MKRLGLAAVLLLGVLLPASAAATQNPSLWYWKDGDRTSYTVTPPVTRAKLQTVLDLASDTTHLYVQLGPGTLWVDSTIWVHGNTSLYGMGKGITTLYRSQWSATLPTNKGHGIVSAQYRLHDENDNLSGGLPRDSLQNIELRGFTFNGGWVENWPLENPNVPGAFGIQFWFVDWAQIVNVEVTNTGQTGIELDACRNSLIENCRMVRTGQEVMLGTRNGININNNSGSLNASVFWARRIICRDNWIINQKDAALDCANNSELEVLNTRVFCDHDTTYGNMVHEWEGSLVGYVMHDIRIVGTIARGTNNQFFQNGINGASLHRMTIKDCYFVQGDSPIDSTRARWAVLIGNANPNGGTVRDFLMEGCYFDSLNAGGVGPAGGAGRLLYIAGRANGYNENITVRDCSFRGVNQAEDNSSNIGVDIAGSVKNLLFDNVKIYGAEREGFYVHNDTNALGTYGVKLVDCLVDGANSNGYRIGASGYAKELNGVELIRCRAKDTNATLTGPSFYVAGTTNGEITRNIRLVGCVAEKTSGTNMQGLQIHQSGTGVCDSVWTSDCDFSHVNAPTYTETNTPTNVFRWNTGAGQRVLQNNEWLYWRKASPITTTLPTMRTDSTNTLVIQPVGNVDVMNPAGTQVKVRFFSGSNQGMNITNNARQQFGGFDWAYDSGNERRFLQKSNLVTGASGFFFYDSAQVHKEAAIFPGGTFTFPRLGPISWTTSGGAIRIVDGQFFPITVAGVQAAIDECSAAGGGTVWIPDNANITLASTPIVLKNKVALKSFGSKTHDSGTVFKANGSTNVPFAIVAGDTAGGQQLFQLDGITIDGTGGRIDWGIYSKLNFVGSKIENCRVTKTGIGIGIIGANATSIGSFMVRNTIVNDMTSSYCILQEGGSRNVVYDGIELDRPGRNTAALYVNGSSTSSAGSITTTIRNSYGELSDSMSVWLKVNGAAAVEVDGLHVTHPTGRFRAAVEIQNTVPGNFGFSPSGFTLRNLYADSDTLIVNQPIGEYITTGSDFNNPYRHVSWYSPSLSIGSASTNGYRNSNMTVGMQPARVGPAIASAATIVPPPDGSVFGLTGVTGITDVTFLDSFMGKIVVFVSSSGPLTITAGNHWKINGNWTANGTGNWDTLTGYVTAGHDFIEIGRCIQ